MSNLWYKFRCDFTAIKLRINIFTNDKNFTKSPKTDVLLSLWTKILVKKLPNLPIDLKLYFENNYITISAEMINGNMVKELAKFFEH